MAELFVSASAIRNKVLDAITGRVGSATIGSGHAYLALLNKTPAYTAAGEININNGEVSGTGYKRHLLGHNTESSTLDMSAAAAGQTKNSREIHFDQIPADGSGWGDDATYWAIFAAETGGTCLVAGPLTAPVSLDAGKVVIIHANELNMQFNLVTA